MLYRNKNTNAEIITYGEINSPEWELVEPKAEPKAKKPAAKKGTKKDVKK